MKGTQEHGKNTIDINILLITKLQICAPSQHLDHRKMDVIDFEINLCHKRVFTNDLLFQWVVHKERAGTEGERADWKVRKTGQMLQKGEKRVS